MAVKWEVVGRAVDARAQRRRARQGTATVKKGAAANPMATGYVDQASVDARVKVLLALRRRSRGRAAFGAVEIGQRLAQPAVAGIGRSEEHTSELQSLV